MSTKVSFEAIGEEVVTFSNKSSGGAKAGDCVKMSGNGQVCACANGNRFFGVAVSADSEYAAVQTRGFITMPYTSTAPTVGWGHLVSDGNGGVKKDSGNQGVYTGDEYLVVAVDVTGGTVTFVI